MTIYPNDITVGKALAYPYFILKLVAGDEAMWAVAA